MMDVEDSHLNLVIDMINTIVITSCQPLKHLSQHFNPSELVYRLCQLIIIYEKNIGSDSAIDSLLQTDTKSAIFSQTMCSIVKYWLLEYYKTDFVIINGLNVNNGCEDQMILTTLMVLRVLYRMRHLMDQRIRQILTNGWKDLHDFDKQLDDMFQQNSLKFTTLLVKQSNNYILRVNSYVKQINELNQKNKDLMDQLRIAEEKIANQNYFNGLSLMRIATTFANNITYNDNSMTQKPKRKTSPKRTIKSNNESAIRKNTVMTASTHKTNNAVNGIIFRNLRKSQSPNKTVTPVDQSSVPITRSCSAKIQRIINGMSSVKSVETTFREIRAIFSEPDDSEFEYFEAKQQTQQNTEMITNFVTSKKRTHSSNHMEISSQTLKNNENKVCRTLWPSRNREYPRNKRYPCKWMGCNYLADRPSTLIRHERRHTGEKPFACDWPGCDKRYKMSSNLTPHKLTHKGIRPYICDRPACGLAFTYPQHLKRHRIARHGLLS